jgi:Sec-independent protein translocase protein TatA
MLGKGLSEFRRAKNELKSTFETHLHELEREANTTAEPPSKTPSYASPRYPYTFDEYGQSEPNYSSPAPIQESSSEPPKAVEGTVPRSNGVHPAGTDQIEAKQEHPA